MIPDFNEHGYLPPGVHPTTLAEIEERFGRASEIRHAQMQSLGWLVDLARKAGIERLIVNGSFVADVFEPNDVDCVVLVGTGPLRDRQAFRELRKGLPFIHMQLVRERRFHRLVQVTFATDRRGNAKGMVEVAL